MHCSTVSALLWIASFLLTAATLAVLLHQRLARAWPSVVTLLSLDLLLSVLLYFVRSHYAWYFYLFWGGSALRSMLSLWVMADTLRSIPGAGFIQTRARIVILSLTLAMAIGSGISAWGGQVGWVLELPNHGSEAKLILQAILLYNRAVSFASLTLVVGVLGAVYLIGLGWDYAGATIASALGFQFTEVALRSVLFTESTGWLRLGADYLDGFTHLIVLAVWLRAFLNGGDSSPVSTPASSPERDCLHG